MVAPPRICGKTTVANFTAKILREFPKTIENQVARMVKTPTLLQNKATPEALIKAMEPKELLIPTGSFVRKVNQGSQIAIVVPELETFMGKQKYNEGLIGLLMDIYDCHDEWEYHSITHGVQKLSNMYVTFLGGTTPDGLDMSINDAAFGQGFMSRMVIIYEPRSPRCFPIPKAVKAAPPLLELCKRLGWIAQHQKGEYTLSKEALDKYIAWYTGFKVTLEAGGSRTNLLYRMDNTLLKLALLIRANRYEDGNVIEIQDYDAALKILEATYRKAWEALDNVGATDYHRHMRLAEQKIKDKGQCARRELLTNIRWTNSAELTSAMNQLFQEGKIKIMVGTSSRHAASADGKEMYIWTIPV